SRMMGASIRTFTSVAGIEFSRNSASVIFKSASERSSKGEFDFVLNCTGPSAGKLLAASGVANIGLVPTLGTMIVFKRQFTSSVLNRMRPPSDGDIIVPYGCETIGGTQALFTDDPEKPEIVSDDLNDMKLELARMIPTLRDIGYDRYYYSFRPLVTSGSESPREATRDFFLFNHSRDNDIPMITILGGKFTTARLAGYEAATLVSEMTGGEKIRKLKLDFEFSVDRLLDSSKSALKGILEVAGSRSGGLDDRLAGGVKYVLASSLFNNSK
ncbi:MAG: FAD-dependent oxidoreductase, partial [Thermoplasmataceae archaeon]